MTSNTKHPAGTTHTRDGDSYKVGVIVQCWEYGEWVSCDNAWEIDDWLEELTPVNPEDVDVLPFERYRTKDVVKHEWLITERDSDQFFEWFKEEFPDASLDKDVEIFIYCENERLYKAYYTEKKTMKYILFGGQHYYAKGGWHDYLGHGKELNALIDSECLKDYNVDWWHIVDTETKEIIAGSKCQAHNSDFDDIEDRVKQKYVYDSDLNKWVQKEEIPCLKTHGFTDWKVISS